MNMDYMIWPVTFMSGVRIGMEITTVTPPLRTRQGRTTAQAGCYGVVLGAAGRAAYGWLAAATAIHMLGAAATAFDVCQDRINYPWPHEARAFSSEEGSSFTTGQLTTKTVRSHPARFKD